MTALLCRTAPSAALTPVLSTLAVMRAEYGESVVAGIAPAILVDPAEGWLPARQLLTSNAAVDDLLDAAKQRWNATDHVAASLAWKAYTRWLALPAVLGYAAGRRVPDVSLDNVLVRFRPSDPHLVTIGLRQAWSTGLPGDPAANRVVADEAALRSALRATLIDGHLEPLMARIRGRVHVGRRTLWGSLASAIGLMLSRGSRALPGSAIDIATSVLSTLDMTDLVTLSPQPDGKIDVQRRTCCLAFALPEPKICGGCVIPVMGAGD